MSMQWIWLHEKGKHSFLSFFVHKTSRQVQIGSPADQRRFRLLTLHSPASSFSTSTTPRPAVQFHAFSQSFVPDNSRRLSRMTGFRGRELVLPLQPRSPAAPALIGNSPRLPSGLLSSVLTCKTAGVSRLSGPVGPLLAAISGFMLHAAKLFGCQCVSFWSHFKLLRI